MMGRFKGQNGYTVYETIIAISMIGILSVLIYANGAGKNRVSEANLAAMSAVMENIAGAVEAYYWEHDGTLPANIAATGYTPPPHPFGGIYGFQADAVNRTVRVTSTIPKGTGRAIGVSSNVVCNVDATSDRAEIFKPFTTNGDWYDKYDLYKGM